MGIPCSNAKLSNRARQGLQAPLPNVRGFQGIHIVVLSVHDQAADADHGGDPKPLRVKERLMGQKFHKSSQSINFCLQVELGRS